MSKIVDPMISRNASLAHSENVLLAMPLDAIFLIRNSYKLAIEEFLIAFFVFESFYQN